ncbi:MAG: MFS transporter [Methanobacteriota archaeon]|nr:MAG: MFS transporter [Euryarchaeota archaeon]
MLTVTTIGVLMAGIDSRIVIVGLPQVAANIGADAEQAIWITQAYVLGSTVALLLIGRVSDIVGRVKIYTAGFSVFTVGSLLTSLAVNPMMLIAFRGLQGLGSGMMFTNSAAIVTDAFPDNELGLAIGVNQVAFRAGAMTGLTVSGLILTFLDWRALFYVNVPIGIAGTLWAHRRLRELAKLEKGAPIDWLGFVTFTTCIGSFLLALTSAAYGTAEMTTVVVLLTVSAVALVLFSAVFILLPALLTKSAGHLVSSGLAFNLAEGALRLAMFLGYIVAIGDHPPRYRLRLPRPDQREALRPVRAPPVHDGGPCPHLVGPVPPRDDGLLHAVPIPPCLPRAPRGRARRLRVAEHELDHGLRPARAAGRRVRVPGHALQRRFHDQPEPRDPRDDVHGTVRARDPDDRLPEPRRDLGAGAHPVRARSPAHVPRDGGPQHAGDRPLDAPRAAGAGEQRRRAGACGADEVSDGLLGPRSGPPRGTFNPAPWNR